MNTPVSKWPVNSMRRALAGASILLTAACGAEGAGSSGATITRLDDSTIDTTALTEQIEALTRAANVHGLTVTIFNGAEKVYSRAFGVAKLDVPRRFVDRTGLDAAHRRHDIDAQM